jgi:branched-chain amino acid transport system ATP-binding protein
MLASNLHAFYGKSHVLHGVHFDVQAGEIVACSGATARAARPRSRPSWAWSTARLGPLRDQQMLGRKAFEIAHLGHRLRAGEPRHLSQAHRAPEPDARQKRGATRKPRWSFDDMYRLFPRLKERQHTEAGVLSGGEQQMLTLCRTLMGDPDLIMIDEPTEGLAPKIVELVAEYLRELKRRGISVLLVEQKLTIALEVSTAAYVMGHGQIVFEGTPAELRANAYIRKEWLEV